MATLTACCFLTAVIHTDLVNTYQLRHYLVVISSLFNSVALLQIVHGYPNHVVCCKKLSRAEVEQHSFGHAKAPQPHITSTLQKFSIISWAATLEATTVFWQRSKHCRTAAEQSFWTTQNTNQQSAAIVNNRAFHKKEFGELFCWCWKYRQLL